MMKIAPILIIAILLFGCSEPATKVENLNQESQEQLKRSFLTANDVVDRSNSLLEDDINNTLGSFERKLVTLKSAGGTKEEITNMEELTYLANYIHLRSSSLQNELVRLSDWLISESNDRNYGKVNPGDPSGDRHYYVEQTLCRSESEKFSLLPLNNLENLLEQKTVTKLLIGDPDRPEATYLLDSFLVYRDFICSSIGNHIDYWGNEATFSSNGLNLSSNSSQDINNFYQDIRVQFNNADARDTSTLLEINNILTKPEYTYDFGDKTNWLTANFNNATLVSSLVILNSLKNEVILAEKMAIEHLNARIMIGNFIFNKIEAFAYSSNNVIQNDSLKVKIGVVSFDSTDIFKIRYWIDDETKKGKMYEFQSKSGSAENIPIDSKESGIHIIYGEIAVRVKGQDEWKSWEYRYYVPED